MKTYRAQVKIHFDAAHYIKDYLGKCSREHGHRWELEVVFEGEVLDRRNMLIDFKLIKDMLGKLVDETLDHWHLNKRLDEPNVTAEFLAGYVHDYVQAKLDGVRLVPLDHALLDAVNRGVRLCRVTIWESPECCIKCYEKGGEREDGS
jgi:6-pyruvoyltetrahydropterin/6-carboxytetrahydropterin synthase